MDSSERRARAGEEAARWLEQLQAGELSRAEREQFVDWLRESAVHVAEMLHVVQVHGALEHFQRWVRIATEGAADAETVVPLRVAADTAAPQAPADPSRLHGAPPEYRRNKRMWIGALAAAAAGVAIATGWLLIGLGGQAISTERGERRELALSDGSVLQVGPETRLQVRFEAHERRIVLKRGRALFRVAQDPQRPFVVRAGDTLVRAVGTAFGVEQRDQAIVVTVAEGKVAILSRAATSFLPQAVSALSEVPGAGADNATELGAGEQVDVPRTGSAGAGAVRKVDSGRELAWAEGRLVFSDDAVAEVIAEFNRYNHVRLRVADPALARRPISGVFDASDPESFIAFIESVAAVRIERGDGQDITIVAAP